MSEFCYFGGVDFSGAKGPLRNLWSAIGVERQGHLHVLSLRPHPFRWDLAQFLREHWRASAGATNEALLCGIDLPLSIPDAAAAAVVDPPLSWLKTNAWLAQHTPEQVAQTLDRHRKTPRQCDRGLALAPLDMRLYKQTVSGARWLHELRTADSPRAGASATTGQGRTRQAPNVDAEAGVGVGVGANADADAGAADQADMHTQGQANVHAPASAVAVLPQAAASCAGLTLIEVYPSVSRNDLGIKAGRKPKRPGEVRSRAAALESWLSFDHRSMEASALTIEDAWDATLACLTAYLVRDDLDQPTRLGLVDPASLASEGWIYRHPEAWRA